MDEEDLLGILELLAEWKKTNLKSASPPARLHSLTLGPCDGFILINRSQFTITRVVDAHYRSSLPFLQLQSHRVEGLFSWLPSPINAQLMRNQLIWRRHEQLQSKKVPATSLRLFICGDEYAGKISLISKFIHTSIPLTTYIIMWMFISKSTQHCVLL